MDLRIFNLMGKFNFDNKEFLKVRKDAESFYGSIGLVRCPYFGEVIVFNAKGLRHLKFKSDKQARTHKEQYPRLKLLYLAPEVLRKSHTLQGIWETRLLEMQKTNNRWERVMKNVTFYEFIAVLDNVRVKVIAKQVESGEKYFWSVIPYWGIDKENRRRILHSGNPERD